MDGRLVFWKDVFHGMDVKSDRQTPTMGKVDFLCPHSPSKRLLHRSLRFLVFSAEGDL